ncbi:putative inactive phenolphthiocerol synthesis polyketide synthase type I Pks1 [Folsomia candida]|uniref:putative inactive phenolphthiocerol synthesis polyketide synthase type I Pks1 n=1 Tax=Folsomia candida TaxID=158441 RepID=UPI000B8F290E|nr:putative inactive phenolphthiocerol synthesis polyketide synthase type I Pks1 [Folsomia candida]
MGLELYNSCATYRRHFDEVNSHFIDIGGIDLLEWIRDGKDIPFYPQLSIFAVEYALLNMWKEWGVTPNLCVVGHSSGEVMAAMAVGVLNLATAVRLLVFTRQTLINEVEPGQMVALMTDEAMTLQMINQYAERCFMENKSESSWIDISALNSYNQTVVSGPVETSKKFSTFVITYYSTKTSLLKFVDNAFHSRSFGKASNTFETNLEKLDFPERNRGVKYISSMYRRELDDSENLDISYWSKLFTKPVKFVGSAAAATTSVGAKLFLEISPHPTLAPLMKDNCPQNDLICIPSLMKDAENWITLLNAISTLYLHRVELDWSRIWISLFGEDILRNKVSHLLPTYPFQNEGPFWFSPLTTLSQDSEVVHRNKIIHPLLGSMPAVPKFDEINRITIFETSPGYVEMGFAVATLLGKTEKFNNIKLSKVEIKTVLSLDVKSDIQTNVVYDGEGFNISISSRGDHTEGMWTLHASLNAKVITPDVYTIKPEKHLGNFTGESLPSPYPELSDLGYKFCAGFKSLRAGVVTPIFDTDGFGSFMVHPIILDALLQITLLAQQDSLTTLRVPVAISEFELVCSASGNIGKNTCARQIRAQAGINSSTLFIQGADLKWRTLASMTNLRTISTTTKAVRRTIEGSNEMSDRKDHDQLLPLFVEEWVKDDQLVNYSQSICEQFSSCKTISRPAAEIQDYKLISSYIGKCVAETLNLLGFSDFTHNQLITRCDIALHLGLSHLAPNFLARLLKYAGQAGLLKEYSLTEYIVLPYSDCLTHNLLATNYDKHLPEDWAFVEFYTSKLTSFLSGTESILPYLFPPSLPSLEPPNQIVSNETSVNTNFSAERFYSATIASYLTEDFIVDLEKDALVQVFENETFNVIIANNVLHATTDINRVVENLRLLLSPKGNIFIAEQLHPSAFVHIIFGHCKGYWLFNDGIRSDHCLIDGDAWKLVLQSVGYGEVSIVENKDFHFGIIIATNKEDVSPPPSFIVIASSDQDQFANQLVASNKEYATLYNISEANIVIHPENKIVYCFPQVLKDNIPALNQVRKQLEHFLRFSRALVSVGRVELILVSHGLIPVGDTEARYPVAGAIRGFSRTLANEMLELDITWVDLDDDESTMQQIQEVVAEIRNKGTLRNRDSDPFVTVLF